MGTSAKSSSKLSYDEAGVKNCLTDAEGRSAEEAVGMAKLYFRAILLSLFTIAGAEGLCAGSVCQHSFNNSWNHQGVSLEEKREGMGLGNNAPDIL